MESPCTSDTEIGPDSSADGDVTVRYRAGIVKPLSAEEVRWFYKHLQTKKAVPLCGRDSLLVEERWQEVHSCSESTRASSAASKAPQSSLRPHEDQVILDGFYQIYVDSELTRACPVYWTGDDIELFRGTWFVLSKTNSYVPLDSADADEIEDEHLKTFGGQVIPAIPQAEPAAPNAAKIDKKPGAVKVIRGYKSDATFDDGPKPVAHLIFVVHGVGQKRQLNQVVSNANELQCIANDLMKSQFAEVQERTMFLPVDWRCSLKLDEGVVEACTPLNIESFHVLLNSTGLDVLYYESPKYRTEIVKSLVDEINRLYRLFIKLNSKFQENSGDVSIVSHSLGSVIMYDVVTQWSPLTVFEDYVTQRLEETLNSAQGQLKESLQQLKTARDKVRELEGGLMQALSSGQAKLCFRVKNLFNIGSPLAVFLALRGVSECKEILPENAAAERIFNIYHPSDYIAYRLEPLVHEGYVAVKPRTILGFKEVSLKSHFPYRGIPPEYYSLKELKCREQRASRSPSPDLNLECEELATELPDGGELAKATDLPNQGQELKGKQPQAQPAAASPGLLSRFVKGVMSRGAGSIDLVKDQPGLLSMAYSAAESQLKFQRQGKTSPFELTGPVEIPDEKKFEHRLDYIIRPLDYFSYLTAHVCYWTSKDVVCFMQSFLFERYFKETAVDPKAVKSTEPK